MSRCEAERVMSEREAVVTATIRRAEGSVPPRAVYALTDAGAIERVMYALRDSRRYARGDVKCPENAKYLCVEGDAEWQPLPGFVPTAEVKKRESERLKNASRARRESGRARSAASH